MADSEDGQIAYGIEEAMDERGFTVNETMKGFYASETCAPYYRKASFFGNEVPGHSLVPAFSASYNEADTYTVGEAPAELTQMIFWNLLRIQQQLLFFPETVQRRLTTAQI